MSIQQTAGGGFVATGEQSVRLVQMLATRSGMSLELKGLKHSGGSLIARVKRMYNLKGNRQAIYDQFSALCEEAKIKHACDEAAGTLKD